MKSCFAVFHRVYIRTRASFGHTGSDIGSGLQPLLAPHMSPLRIAMKGRGPFKHPRGT